MGLSVDFPRIECAWVVPWEEDEGIYGIGWDLDQGWSGGDRIGTKEEAERELRRIKRLQAARANWPQ